MPVILAIGFIWRGWIVIAVIVLAVLVAAVAGGAALDRRDRRGTGVSRSASDMTRGAMRHRQQYRRRAGR